MNPFAALYKSCNSGTSAEKWAALPSMPTHIDVELTNACNYRCLMCPVGNLAMTRKTEFMKRAVWRKLLEECRPANIALRFIGFGEPLLHPDLVEIIALAAEFGLLTHINTNASKLTPTLARDLALVGLSSIKFSFQGVDRASYAEMRNTDSFEMVFEAIAIMRKARRGLSYPYIAASTSVTYETPAQIEAFRARMAPLVDYLGIGKTTFDYLDFSAVRLSAKELATLQRLAGLSTDPKQHPDPCPEVFDKLSIHSDGTGVVCCNDFNSTTNLGNLADCSLFDIWKHPTIEEYRRRLASRDYGGPLCSVCYDYASLTAGVANA